MSSFSIAKRSGPEEVDHTPEITQLLGQLTGGQRVALQEIQDSLRKNESHVLEGFAGVGKSFLCKVIAMLYPNAVFVSPTHKACQVLSQNMGVPSTTIHSFLGLRPKHGKLEPTKAEIDLTSVDLVVVDEASMITSEVAGYIDHYLAEHVPLLFIGDPKQLPPVKEEESLCFSLPNKSTLTEIVRQASGNPIIMFSKEIREHGFSKRMIPQGHANIVQLPPMTDDLLYQTVLNYYEAGGVYAAWTNAKVDKVNLGVHKLKYGPDTPDWIVGQKVVLNTPWQSQYKTSLGNIGDEFTVSQVHETTFMGFDAYQLHMEEREEHQRMFVIHPKSKEEYTAQLKLHEKHKNWAEYYALKEMFTHLANPYASTCHKLQGSTFEHVIIDAQDIIKNKNVNEMDRCMYVAVTRAKQSIAFV